MLDNSHGSQISLTPDTTQLLFPAPLPPPLTRGNKWGLDCEDETNGGFRETVVMKLTFTQAQVFKNPLESKAH